MEMFLLAFALSLLGVAVSATLFAAATRGVDEHRQEEPSLTASAPAPGFFADERRPEAASPPHPRPRVPIDALLLQIERHVQVEQAAGESFLQRPTRQALHSPSASPLVH
jgi:hypothetical protein